MTSVPLANQIHPVEIRYIKLGPGGTWARLSFENGWLSFGYHAVPHEVCQREDWEEVRRLLSYRPTQGSQTAGVTEVATFYEMGEDCLWITFADGHLWWGFADGEVTWIGDQTHLPSRYRRMIGGWRNTDAHGHTLRTDELSSKLTQLISYQATICEVDKKDRVDTKPYLLRRINGIEQPLAAAAHTAQNDLSAAATEMIRMLHWIDYETLVDIILSRSGWSRRTRVGARLTDVDIVMEQPMTGETAFVQVKSTATQAVLDDYLLRFRASGHDHFFFICHTTPRQLRLAADRGLHLFDAPRLADAAIKTGLLSWLVERST